MTRQIAAHQSGPSSPISSVTGRPFPARQIYAPRPRFSASPFSTVLGLAKPLVLLCVGLVLVSGCNGETKPSSTNAVPREPSSLPSSGPDTLAPGELPIGPIKAFGLPIPRGFREHFRGPQIVEADGDNSAETVANFIRMHATFRTVETGAARTVFDKAKAKGSSTPLRIEVVHLSHGTRIIVRDMRPLRVDPKLTDEQRWNKYGFDKNGRLLNPEKLQ